MNEGGGVTHKHGIAGGTYDHAEDGKPNVRHAHGWVHAIANTQHVAHSLKQSIGVLLTPCIILQRRKEKEGELKDNAGE